MSKYSLDNPNLEVCLICTNYRFLEIIPNLEVCLICTNYRFPELGLSIPKKPLDVVTTISAACTDQLAQTLQQGPEVDSNCVHMTTPTSKHIALTWNFVVMDNNITIRSWRFGRCCYIYVRLCRFCCCYAAVPAPCSGPQGWVVSAACTDVDINKKRCWTARLN